MDGGCPTTTTVQEKVSIANGIRDEFSILCINGDKDELILEKVEKDPRRIARKYQIDLCKKAKEENVIVYMGTGCGKTHIAVLLIYEMGHLIKKPQKNVCIFLAPTVALVQQQAKVIEKSIDFKVGTYCGSSTNFKGRNDWEKVLGEYEVLVMTPQILLHYLSHCFIKLELIALLIFDECHYAQHESNHPYAEIMKVFYKKDLVKLPRIFGMTASPKLGKAGSIDGLEALLRAKVYCVEDKDELDQFVTSPKVKVYYYDSNENGYSCCAQAIYTRKLDEIRHQCASTFRVTTLDQNSLRNSKKSLQKLHSNLKFCLENLGVWGALQASNILLKGDHYENADVLEGKDSYSEDNLFKKKYLNQAESVLSSECSTDVTEADMSSVEVLKEPIFSRKLLRLIDILCGFRSQPNMKCIIFVNRIITARSLSYILRSLKFLSSWKCGFLVGVHSGLVSRKNTSAILEKFRSGELNLLVATKVGEEGLDIQTCCLVIRFDLPETVASFIQSRGRARMPQSEYAFLVDRANPGDIKLIDHFKKDEDQMNAEISSRKSVVPMDDFEGSIYQVESTGATVSSISSISLLHRYCSKLPHDEYFIPKPQFFPVDSSDGMTCTIILPANAPIHEVTSSPQSSAEEARRDACLKACKALHEVGALTDYLLPEEDSYSDNESTHDFSDSEPCDDDDSRAELHKMLIPAALREPWSDPGSYTCFSSYYIEICPDPADRTYRKFGLYVKSPLPEGAERMKLDLCLARGRMVITQLVPSGFARLDKDEIESAEKYQRMFLKAILDRESLKSEFVTLEENDDANASNSSTFYLLLPVIQQEDAKISIDWTLIKRCLSSPIFRQPEMSNCVSGISQLKKNRLHLANGYRSVDDIVNSFVYVPCKNTFYFISDIFSERNGLSMFDESKTHSEHCMTRYNINLLHPYQPLLKAKQLFVLDNLLRKRKHKGDWRDKEEHFIELPPEICQLKIIGFSKDIGSSLSLLPSVMHRLESFLVAIELKDIFAASFPEGAEVTHDRILEALTTERCAEHFSLERLEVLGDAFLKLAVGRYVFLKHNALDEGQLTRKRSNIVSNSNLFKLAKRNNLQVYIRDAPFEADQFYAFGRPCPVSCNNENEKIVHPQSHKHSADVKVQCNQSHHWLQKKTIADVVEAITGAFIVDCGFKAATAFLNWIGIQVDFMTSQVDNIRSASKIFVPLSDKIDLSALESILGYKFSHKGLLIQAFIHPSFNEHLGGCYQRLEFLGDALLDYLITSYLYSVYPKLKPGQLTDLRSAAVNNISFADVAGRCSFHKHIICDSSVLLDTMNKYVNSIGKSASARGHDEEKSCPKALGDLVESCMGAIYLDTGFDLKHAWNIVLSLLSPIISPSKLQFNPLRGLMELAQSYYWELKFSSVKKDGKFTVEAKVDEKNVSVTTYATDVSGKSAKRKASRELFERLKALGYKSKSKSLEEVLRKSEKKEARLIGYDESPSHETTKSCHAEVHKALHGNHDVKVHTPNGKLYKVSRPTRQSPGSQKSSEPQVKQSVERNGHVDDLPSIKLNNPCTDTPRTVSPSASAKSHLYEVCTANCWKPPVFECCNETGPSHLKEFLFKVILEMEEFPNEIFEFYGEPCLRKKEAAELAAEGALWYLKHEGYVFDKKAR